MPRLITNKRKNNKILVIKVFILTTIFYCQISHSNPNPKQLDPKYGSAQNPKFIEAMYGLSPPVTDDELQKIENSIPARTTNRFFIRFGANSGTSSISKVKNTSVQPITKTAIIASSNQATSSKNGGELAFGYRWDNLSLELEAMATENTKYNKTPLFSNQAGGLTSVVKAQGIFINTYYDFVSLMAFRAFFGLGIGAGINRTNSNFFNAPPISTGENFARRRVAGAYNVVLGCKINLVPQLFLNGAIRYTNFAGFGNIKIIATSNVEWRDPAQNLHLEGQHTLFAFSISLTHLFL